MTADRQTTKRTSAVSSKSPSYQELVRLVGALRPAQLAAIERSGATVGEIEQAVAFASGEDDVMGEARIPLSGRVAEIYEIITADEAQDDER